MKPKAVILSGGPASVLDKDAPLAPKAIYDAGVPVLGICYGEQAMAAQLGGKVEGGHHREFGRAEVEVDRRQPDLRRRLEEGREISGLDEPRRPRDRIAAGLPRARQRAELADLDHRRRRAQILRHAVPSRGDAHAARRGAAAQFRAQGRGPVRRLDHARLQGRGDRENPQAGRQGPRDLRPVRRRRLGGRRGADPRSDRRAAHLRVRRSRPAAARRSREGRRAVPRQLQYSAGACERRGDLPQGAQRRRRPGAEAQDHRQIVHRRVRRRGEEDRRRRIPRARHALSRT